MFKRKLALGRSEKKILIYRLYQFVFPNILHMSLVQSFFAEFPGAGG